jgi:hypothetical protein
MNFKSGVAALALTAIASSAFAQQPATIVKPAKHIDPVWNGVLIGAGAGAVGAWVFTRANCGPPGYDDECTAIAAVAGTSIFVPGGMLVGGIIDRLINKTLPPGATSRTSVVPTLSGKSGKKIAGVALKMKISF